MINEALQRLLIENLTTATLLLDARLRLEYMNPAAEMLLAVSGQRSHGQFISELFTESAEALSALRQAVEQAHPFTKREATLTSSSGQTLTVDYAVTPILTRRETLLLLEVLPRDLARQQGVKGLKQVLRFDSAELYLGLNAQTADDTVAKLQAALDQMRADGTVEVINARYL